MNIIQKIREEQHGFILDADVEALTKHNRFTRCLVRCGCGRFVCPVQDVKHFVDIVTKSGIDYVRDVSLAVN